MEENSLDYPVLLMGRKVAEDQFFVSAYPSQFWIDANGVIIDRVTGFDVKEAAVIERRIEELLDER